MALSVYVSLEDHNFDVENLVIDGLIFDIGICENTRFKVDVLEFKGRGNIPNQFADFLYECTITIIRIHESVLEYQRYSMPKITCKSMEFILPTIEYLNIQYLVSSLVINKASIRHASIMYTNIVLKTSCLIRITSTASVAPPSKLMITIASPFATMILDSSISRIYCQCIFVIADNTIQVESINSMIPINILKPKSVIIAKNDLSSTNSFELNYLYTRPNEITLIQTADDNTTCIIDKYSTSKNSALICDPLSLYQSKKISIRSLLVESNITVKNAILLGTVDINRNETLHSVFNDLSSSNFIIDFPLNGKVPLLISETEKLSSELQSIPNILLRSNKEVNCKKSVLLIVADTNQIVQKLVSTIKVDSGITKTRNATIYSVGTSVYVDISNYSSKSKKTNIAVWISASIASISLIIASTLIITYSVKARRKHRKDAASLNEVLI